MKLLNNVHSLYNSTELLNHKIYYPSGEARTAVTTTIKDLNLRTRFTSLGIRHFSLLQPI